jgi:hypothetical protein
MLFRSVQQEIEFAIQRTVYIVEELPPGYIFFTEQSEQDYAPSSGQSYYSSLMIEEH